MLCSIEKAKMTKTIHSTFILFLISNYSQNVRQTNDLVQMTNVINIIIY